MSSIKLNCVENLVKHVLCSTLSKTYLHICYCICINFTSYYLSSSFSSSLKTLRHFPVQFYCTNCYAQPVLSHFLCCGDEIRNGRRVPPLVQLINKPKSQLLLQQLIYLVGSHNIQLCPKRDDFTILFYFVTGLFSILAVLLS